MNNNVFWVLCVVNIALSIVNIILCRFAARNYLKSKAAREESEKRLSQLTFQRRNVYPDDLHEFK